MRNHRIPPKQLLFFISYGLFIILALCRTTFFYQYIAGKMFNVCLFMCILLMIVGELILGINTRRMIICLLLCGGFVGLAIFVKATTYLVLAATVIYIYCARDISFRKIASFSAWVLFVALCIVVLSSQIGLIKDYVDLSDNRNRHFLGFLYSLYPSIVMMNVTMSSVYVRKQKMMWIEIAFLTLVNAWFFKMTGSRLSAAISFASLLFAIIMKLNPVFLEKKIKIKRLLACLYLVLAVLSLVISVKYNKSNSIMAKANSVLSGRLRLQHEAMEKYGFSFWGQEIQFIGNGLTVEGEPDPKLETEPYFYVDNVYVQWFVKNGFIFWGVLLLIFTALSFRSITYEPQGYLIIMMALMAIYCTIQDTILFVHFNSFLLCAGNLLCNNKSEAEIENEEESGSAICFKV